MLPALLLHRTGSTAVAGWPSVSLRVALGWEVSSIPLCWSGCWRRCVCRVKPGRFSLHSAYRDTMLIVAGFNFVLMIPGAYWMKTRLPPHRPPPWSDMKRPWKETRFIFHVMGAMMFGMK